MTIDLKKHLFPLRASILYWLKKEDNYSLQSPFVANLYRNLKLYLQNSKTKDLEIEDWRKALLQDEEILEIEDYGAGSKKLNKQRFRSTKAITRYSTSNRKFSQLYQYFCMQSPGKCVIELGTCVGLNTFYLSKVVQSHLYTFEGSKSLIRKAKEGCGNQPIKFVEGDIGKTLPAVLDQMGKVDFILLDANHTYEGTITYLKMVMPYLHDQSVVAIGDIHWSKEMEKAWEEIAQQPQVSLSLDFFECGILFFRKGLAKSQHILSI